MRHVTKTPVSNLRRLWPVDLPQITDHLLRLDPETRRLRFGSVVTDAHLRDHAKKLVQSDSIAIGAFPDGRLRGLGELRGIARSWPPSAEAALSVEPAWQGRGLGNALFGRVVRTAQSHGVAKLHLLCLRENDRMRHLVSKYRPVLDIQADEIEAELTPRLPNLVAVARDIASETRGLIRLVRPHRKLPPSGR